MDCYLNNILKKGGLIHCQLNDQSLDIINFFAQFLTMAFAILFGLLAILILIQIFKS